MRKIRDIAVIGAGGFVGSAVVGEARKRGFRVMEITRESYRAPRGESCDILVNANGNSKKFLARRDPGRDFKLSVQSVAESLQDFRFRRYVHLSTIDVYPDVSDPCQNGEETLIDTGKLSPYGFHKYLAEELVRYYAPSSLVVRMGGFVGPGLRKNSIYDLLQGEILRVHPDSAYQYLDTRDFARILFDLLGHAKLPPVINVAGDGVVTLREIAEGLSPPRPLDAGLENGIDRPRQHYEVCIDRLKALLPVPETRDSVGRFVEDVLAGREQLA